MVQQGAGWKQRIRMRGTYRQLQSSAQYFRPSAPRMPVDDVLNAARSQILRTAIEQRIANARGAQAIDLHDRMTDALTPADRHALEVPIAATRDDTATDPGWRARTPSTAEESDRSKGCWRDENPDQPLVREDQEYVLYLTFAGLAVHVADDQCPDARRPDRPWQEPVAVLIGLNGCISISGTP